MQPVQEFRSLLRRDIGSNEKCLRTRLQHVFGMCPIGEVLVRGAPQGQDGTPLRSHVLCSADHLWPVEVQGWHKHSHSVVDL